jgi:hypothetical protein
MKRTLMVLVAVCGFGALGGCVGFVPVGPGYHGGYHGGAYNSPPPRAYRDRDGDGVPNRYDRRPNNPYRY